jgi:hypothetical protein
MKKQSYEKLGPADQLAIDTMVQKAKKEDLEEAYRQWKSRETLDNRPMSSGNVLFTLFMILVILGVFVFVGFAIRGTAVAYYSAPIVCGSINETYVRLNINPLLLDDRVSIVCSKTIININRNEYIFKRR